MWRSLKYLFLLAQLLANENLVLCGHSKFGQRVIEGYRPKDFNLPKYVVSLWDGDDSCFGCNFYCSGSILNERTIVTAAHCIDTYDVDKIVVVAGGIHRLVREKSMQMRRVSKSYIHPDYRFADAYADIGLLILNKELHEDNKAVQRLPLIDRNPAMGWKCIMLGWGTLFSMGPTPDKIVYGNVTIFGRPKCNKYVKMSETQFCGGHAADESSTLGNGDSGGPLICGDEKLAGIVSFATNMDSLPGYFTNVYFFREWILKNCSNGKVKLYFLGFLNIFISLIT